MKIVVVEDDEMLAEMYQLSIEGAGMTCAVARDGEQALIVIQEHLPDLVLLDLMLPQLNGDEVLKRLRQSDWGKDMKVIISTNISESELPDGLHELGFERLVIKANTSPSELVDIIKMTATPRTA